MAAKPVQEPTELLGRMVASRQLSSLDAATLTREKLPAQNEDEVLRWLATEYGLSYTTLEDINPDRQLLSLFPARILLKEELLPLQRVNGHVWLIPQNPSYEPIPGDGCSVMGKVVATVHSV